MKTTTAAQSDDFDVRLQATLDYWTPILGPDLLAGDDDIAYADMVDALMEADSEHEARTRRAAFHVVQGGA